MITMSSRVKETYEIKDIALGTDEDVDEQYFILLPDLEKCGTAFTIPVYQLLFTLEKLGFLKIPRKKEVVV